MEDLERSMSCDEIRRAVWSCVDFAKAYDSVRWDYLLEVLEACGFGRTWCNWIQGTLISAKASILINRSPSKEYSCHRGLKQEDPLYLNHGISPFIFNRVVDEGLFKGIQLPGVMVGEYSSRIKAWNDVLFKLRSRLSKWKVKTLLIGGRLTLLKFVLGASPIYNMSIFKVPTGFLKVMETIRSRFFNGADQSSNWCSIMREVNKLKGKGFDFWSHCKKRIGNGDDSRFWFDCWIGDVPLRVKFPRLFALDLNKEASVAVKLSAPIDVSFRRNARGDGSNTSLLRLTSSLGELGKIVYRLELI
nr:RNA-directed DNA polymerase, eukaryota, reverse transcriptase zinc-binding domain protein [Tanacetum cinerariifolium]